jgi:hypothetical protein
LILLIGIKVRNFRDGGQNGALEWGNEEKSSKLRRQTAEYAEFAENGASLRRKHRAILELAGHCGGISLIFQILPLLTLKAQANSVFGISFPCMFQSNP